MAKKRYFGPVEQSEKVFRFNFVDDEKAKEKDDAAGVR